MPPKIVWTGRWSKKHNNIRYYELFKRLSSLAVIRVPETIWRPLEAFYIRMGYSNPTVKSPLWAIMLWFLGLRYRYLLVTTSELHHTQHFSGKVIVDDDDPFFTAEHLAQLNHPNVVAVVTTTDRLRQRLFEEGLKKPCEVVPSGVDLARISPMRVAEIQSLFKPASNLAIGFATPRLYTDADSISHLTQKSLRSITFLTSIMEVIWENYPNTHLWLIGAPSEYVRKYAQQHSQVKLLGYIPHKEILNYYANFDIAVYPRWTDLEGRHSIKLLEYMVCGVPVVSTDVTESFYVAEANAGLISHTPEQFINHIQQLIEDQRLRRELGENGRVYAQEFDWNVIAHQYESNVFGKYIR